MQSDVISSLLHNTDRQPLRPLAAPEPMPQYQFTVETEPAFLPDQSAPGQGIYSFAYTITITNTGDAAAQLIARHWFIQDASGRSEQVQGLGVVGQQPLLRPGEAFQYTSGCRLRASTGTMHGSYFFVAEDGTRFDVEIPLFVLDASQGAGPSIAAVDDGPRVLH
ncbi:MAG: Protein ApaG [Paracidovorax wautersii]|uniref:Protein ApaG n=1 Tax=Paracidovorax wautersii TaxID=1177982 RepID=A0A7V8FNF5_9BURK|nr:MAG: Protein ApaG [Paracidovorax wautersii]